MTKISSDTLWMSGNEAIALGAWEAGVKVASGYPGTPSTEIMENLSTYEGVYTEWAPNEKVGLEVAIGASFAGVRALATMKHVGRQRGRRSALHRLLHRGLRRAGPGHRRRSGDALLPERAGQPQLRLCRQAADARALRSERGQGDAQARPST